jgi:hypothetical protein
MIHVRVGIKFVIAIQMAVLTVVDDVHYEKLLEK